METKLFRKVALERLSSPDQLDLLMQITTPKGWLGLMAMGGLLCFAIVWGIWGTIHSRVTGMGILVKTGGVFDIVSDSTGRVKDLYLREGDSVQKGQMVARIAQPELVDKVNSARSILSELENRRKRVLEFNTEHLRLEGESMNKQRISLEHTIGILEERTRWLGERIESQEQLLKQGLITKQQLMDTRKQLNETKQEIERTRNQFKQLESKFVELKNVSDKELLSLDQQVADAKMTLKALQNDLNNTGGVVSHYTGRVMEVAVDEGTIVNRGAPLLRVELGGKEIKDLEAVLFFPATEGKRIRPGMRVQVSPTTVKQEEYGHILGIVTYVSEFPTSSQSMMRILRSEDMVKRLSMGGSPIEVSADLIPDPRTPTGYKWSSSSGPSVRINTGTLCLAGASIEERRPISLVIPLLKKHILGVGEDRIRGT